MLLWSCNLSASQSVDATPTSQPPPGLASQPTQFATLTPLPSKTPTSPALTATPIPCDPLITDYCISAGNFRFQRPILAPDNDYTDITYLYASTQNGKRDPHHGVEFQNAYGTPVYASGDGRVVFADADKSVKFAPWTNFYGNLVVIEHTDEAYTLYAHLSAIAVQAGQQVRAGELIGQVGATGGATGSHLHFEVRMGSDYTAYFSTQNPELWLIPQPGSGALSITLSTNEERNYERPLVVTRLADDGKTVLFTYYITSYAKGFEHNAEDAALNSLPAGLYKIAFNDASGLRERVVPVQAGNLTKVIFEVK